MGSAFAAEPREWFSDEDRAELVTFAGESDLVMHWPHPECRIECPHPISECGRFQPAAESGAATGVATSAIGAWTSLLEQEWGG